MTRLLAKTIPSAFIRLDATMSDPDAYVCARDLQVRAENHNKLVACRARQPMFTLSFHDDTDARDPTHFRALGVLPELAASGQFPTPVFRAPIWVPPHCKTATLTGRLAFSNAGGINVKVFGIIHSPTEFPNPPSATLTVTSTTHARYSGTITIPPDVAAAGFAMFSLFIDGSIYGSDLKGGGHAAIVDVGFDGTRQYIDADFANAAQAGDALYILDSGSTIRADIEPRQIVEKFDIGTAAINGSADTDRLYLDAPFNIAPAVGSDLAEARAVQGLNLFTLSLWPDRVSNFDLTTDQP